MALRDITIVPIPVLPTQTRWKVLKMASDRYARQQLIEWWNQERLRNARVLVAGVGALGNEVLKNLALVGVGHLLLIDFDRVEYSNLSRTVLFRENDVG